jgi:hypothetical protein
MSTRGECGVHSLLPDGRRDCHATTMWILLEWDGRAG